MNVFDFDKTVYPKDSTAEFITCLAWRYPSVAASLVKSLPAVVAYKRGRISKTAMKQSIFACFARVPDIDAEVRRFWDKRIGRIEGWYTSMKREDDVIISASPEFLLAEACARLGVSNLIASRVDKRTGRYSGENCYGEEKPKRFAEKFPTDLIECFYSDSYSDAHMARLAKKAYKITRRRAEPWQSDRM